MRLRIAVLALASAAAQLAAADPALGYVTAYAPASLTSGPVVSCPSTKCAALTVAGTQTTGNGSNNNVQPASPVIANANGFRYWAHSVTAAYVSDNKSCGASSFQIQGSPATVGASVPAKLGGVNGAKAVTGISVKFTGNGQCRSATVTLSYTVS